MLRVTAKNLQRLRCKIPPPWGRHYATESTTTNASTTTDASTTTNVSTTTDAETNVVKSSFKDVQIPSMNVTDFVWEFIDRWPNHTAIVCDITGRRYTYVQLRERSRRFATSMQKLRREPGSAMGIILPNCPDYPIIVMGAFEAGLVVAPFSPIYNSAEIARQLIDANPRVVVTYPEKYQQVVEATKLAAAAGYRPPVYVVVQALLRKDVPAGAIDAWELMEHDMDPIPLIGHDMSPDTPIVIPYSSGTTGWPKGVMISHRNVVACSNQMNDQPSISIGEYTAGNFQDRMVAVLPFYHIYGLMVVLLSKLRIGGQIITLPKFEPKTFMKSLQSHKVTVLCLVPPLVMFMGSYPNFTPDSLRHLRCITCGAANLGEVDVSRMLERFPHATLMQGYALTETTASGMITPKGNAKHMSVGRCVPNTMVKIIDVTTGAALEAGGTGEICFKGPQVMLGYYENQKATDNMIDKAGWLHTGDIGYYDKDHDFFVVDRLKELIKVKGFQVAPAELEDILRSHPDVADAAVIGVPEVRGGEVPLAFIVPKPTATSKNLKRDLRDFVAGQVSKFKQIKEVRIVAVIPKSPTGKILRKELRKMYQEEKS